MHLPAYVGHLDLLKIAPSQIFFLHLLTRIPASVSQMSTSWA